MFTPKRGIGCSLQNLSNSRERIFLQSTAACKRRPPREPPKTTDSHSQPGETSLTKSQTQETVADVSKKNQPHPQFLPATATPSSDWNAGCSTSSGGDCLPFWHPWAVAQSPDRQTLSPNRFHRRSLGTSHESVYKSASSQDFPVQILWFPRWSKTQAKLKIWQRPKIHPANS